MFGYCMVHMNHADPYIIAKHRLCLDCWRLYEQSSLYAVVPNVLRMSRMMLYDSSMLQ